MNGLVIIFTIVDILLSVTLAVHFCHSCKMLEILAVAFTVFFSIYVVVSGIFFWTDLFSFKRVLFAQGVIEVTILVIILWKNKLELDNLNVKKLEIDIIPLFFAIVAIFLVSEKFELFSTRQDQGLYQAEAIAIINEDYHIQHDYSEYAGLNTEEERSKYIQMVKSWGGYYRLSNNIQYPTVDSTDVISDVSGVFHGIVTWPALMALFGVIFGMQNMVQIQTVFMLCAIVLLYYAMEHIAIKKQANAVVLCIFTMSPLVIWIAKSSMTEMFLTLLFTFYLYALGSKNINKLVLAIPLVAFAYFHVSFLIFVPVFFIVHILAYIFSKDKNYLYSSIIMAIGLYTGYSMMSETAAQYFFDNLRRIYFGPINQNNIMLVIFLGCLAMILCSWLATKETIANRIERVKWKKLPIVLSGMFLLCMSYMLFYAYKIGFVYTPAQGWNASLCEYYGKGISALPHMTLYAFIMATGYLIIPIIIVSAIKNKWWLNYQNTDGNTKNLNLAFLLSILFFYTVIFQSAFIRKEVNYYYYYSRYLAFYIPLICILGAICVNQWKRKAIYIIAGVSLISMIVFDHAIVLNKDDTCFEWETLLDIKMEVKDNAAVIIDNCELQYVIGPNLKAVTSADIYPLFDDINKELNDLQQKYEHVYYMTGNTELVDRDMDNALMSVNEGEFTEVYRDKYVHSEALDDPSCSTFPLEIVKQEKNIALYEYNAIEKNMVFSVNDALIGVKEGRKKDGYIESNGVEGVVMYGPYITLYAGNYSLNIPVEINGNTSAYYKIYTYNKANGAETIYATGKLEDVLIEKEGMFVANITFTLPEKAKNVEFLIEESEGTKMKLYDYTLEILQ